MNRSIILVVSGAAAALLLSGAVVLAAGQNRTGVDRAAAPGVPIGPVAPLEAPLAQVAFEASSPAQPIGPVNLNARGGSHLEGDREAERDHHAGEPGHDGSRARESRH